MLYDHQTGSLWSSVRHEAIQGKMKGSKLEVLENLTVTTWAAWKKAHPDTKVLTVRGAQSPGYDRYARYHAGYQRGVRPVQNSDSRLPDKTPVIGIRLGGKQKAYPLRSLPAGIVAQDTFENRPLVIARLLKAGKVVVYERQMDGKALKFPWKSKTGIVVETTTKSTLDLATGQFTAGPLKGRKLKPVAFTQLYWFAWMDYYPKSELWRAPRLR